MPIVSPFSTVKETSSTARTVLRLLNSSPRTGKCFVRPVTCSSGCAKPPRSSTGSSMSTDIAAPLILIPDVHRAAHAVAQEIEADRHRKDHHAGQRGDGRVDVDRGTQGVQHQPP